MPTWVKIVLSAAVTAGLGACGGDDAGGATSDSEQTESAPEATAAQSPESELEAWAEGPLNDFSNSAGEGMTEMVRIISDQVASTEDVGLHESAFLEIQPILDEMVEELESLDPPSESLVPAWEDAIETATIASEALQVLIDASADAVATSDTRIERGEFGNRFATMGDALSAFLDQAADEIDLLDGEASE